MRLELGFLRATAAIGNEDEEAERRICFSLPSEWRRLGVCVVCGVLGFKPFRAFGISRGFC